MTKPATFILLFILSLDTFAQVKKLDGSSITSKQIDVMVTRLMREAEVTGLNLAVINNNKPVHVKSYGFRNKEKSEFIDTSTIFYAASFSKAVFACLVMQLAQEGKIDLDKPLYQYLDKPLPEYVDYKDLAGDDRWKLLTARHCLSHTTGFPNWRFMNPKGNRKLEFFFTPGQRQAYSGEGLVLLQTVIETVTGRELEEMTQERIFRPFGMKRTSYVWRPAFDDNHAWGYDGDGKPIELRKRNKANAAGSMVTTIADYSRFISAIMQGKALSQQWYAQMIHPQIRINSSGQFPTLRTDTTSEFRNIDLSYGLGWGLLKSKYGKGFFKEGHDDGWEHYSISFPEKKTAIIIMTNSSNGESIFKELLAKIIGDTFTPAKWENYTPYRKVLRLSPPALNQYTGLFKYDDIEARLIEENGVLKIDSKQGGLSMVNMYAEKKDHFFTRTADLDIVFTRDAAGKINGFIADDGSGKTELKKVSD